MILDIDQFLSLREQLPVLDVRSESEYREGHIPGSINIPILNDEERKIVGTTYKQQGQKEAIKAGFQLVGPRLLSIVNDAEKAGSEFIVHCWRGGMRSSNFCQFVGMAGMKTHQLKGGYKAYRTRAVESFSTPLKMNVISGFTGSGKSEVLREIGKLGEQIIDLEGLANHKGSVFGAINMPAQPTTEQFQNDLFEVIRKLDPSRPVWVEDESIAIGKIFLPEPFWSTMRSGSLVTLNVPREVRVERLVREYGNVDADIFHECLKGIVKKLGGQHYNTARDLLYAGDMSGSIDVILNYYDKAYGNGLERKRDRIALEVPWDGATPADFAQHIVEQARVMHGNLC